MRACRGTKGEWAAPRSACHDPCSHAWILETVRMIRILEILVALLIVGLLAVLVGVLLPSHGHIERSVEVSSPVRQVYDSVNTFRRYPQWSALRTFDPKVQMTLEGPEAGPGAKVSWTSTSRAMTLRFTSCTSRGTWDIRASESRPSV